MAVTDMVYTAAKSDLLSDTIELSTGVIEVMLVTSSYTNVAADAFVSTPAAFEISCANYVGGFAGSGRKALGSKTFAVTGTQGEFHAANVTWTALGTGATIAGAVIYQKGTSDANSHLLSAYNLTATPTNGGDITLAFNSAGVLVLT